MLKTMSAVTTSKLWQLSAFEASTLMESRKVSPVELLDAVLERHGRLNPALNAIVALDADGARGAARASEQRMMKSKRAGPLDGVPITIKDNIHVKGFRATWGSLLYRDFLPPRDDIAVARLRAAGCVIIGKTNTPEFALSGFTDNRVFGPTRNPWDTEMTPGGSSGGAVSALAVGMAPIALGTDAGGSIRRPASYTSTVGLRPSTGRIARAHGFPGLVADFQVIAPAARTVADVELLYRCMAGPDPTDPASLACAATSNEGGERTRRLRIRCVTSIGDAPIDQEIASAVNAAAAVLGSLGHKVEEGGAPYDTESIDRIWGTLSTVRLARVLAKHPGWREKVHPTSVAPGERGAAIAAVEYVEALDAVTELRRKIAQEFEAFDVLVTPTSGAHPWPIGTPFPNQIAGRQAGARSSAVFTTFVNAAALPAINVPITPSESGMPIGMQLVARYGGDETLLALAREFEAAQPWSARWPKIALISS
jgi:aspartyl-tRNA(Asn)/glutamyl-tRNA(Gln) amidotransferase subunit A